MIGVTVIPTTDEVTRVRISTQKEPLRAFKVLVPERVSADMTSSPSLLHLLLN
jgi:hypothetical protein